MHQPKTWLQDALIPPEPDGHFVMIPLTQGKFALVDEDDYPLVGRLKWCAVNYDHTYYACRKDAVTKRTVYMHALIAGFGGPDHANRNGLDNRRVNLRAATQTQNQANKAPFSNNTSGYKGVTWDRQLRKWRAQIGISYRHVSLGSFTDPVEAARAYNYAALEVHGEFAWLNPVPPGPVPPGLLLPLAGRGDRRRKLTSEIVRECRERNAAGESGCSLAREFGVSQSTMQRAIAGKMYKHVA